MTGGEEYNVYLAFMLAIVSWLFPGKGVFVYEAFVVDGLNYFYLF